ncbi:MAG: hypothetical protein WC496_09790 [Phycisphaerae bacterium]|jgi:hypothetical protein
MKIYFNYERVKQSLKNPKVRTIITLSEWFLFFLILFWLIGLFSVPKYYRPVKSVSDGQVSQYLTNRILPDMHNNSQYDQPFDIVFSEKGINDILVRHIDANNLGKSNLSDVSVTFKRNRILLTGKTVYHGFNFIVTIVLKPYINKEGYFLPGISKILIGKSRIPFAVRAVKRKVLYELTGFFKDSDTANFVGILFSSNRIEPVFPFNHRKLRVEKITLQDKEVVISFLPQQDN